MDVKFFKLRDGRIIKPEDFILTGVRDVLHGLGDDILIMFEDGSHANFSKDQWVVSEMIKERRTAMTDLEKLQKDRDYWKKRALALQKRLDLFPKRSFVSMEVYGCHRDRWHVETKIHKDPTDKVRTLNMLKVVYDKLNQSLNDNGTCESHDIALTEEEKNG